MRIQNPIRGFAFLVTFAALLSGVTLAQSANKEESVASITADRAEIRWQPHVEYGRLILTVSTPGGQVFRKEFEAGTTPSFQLVDRHSVNQNAVRAGELVVDVEVIEGLAVGEFCEPVVNLLDLGQHVEVVIPRKDSGQDDF